MCTSCGKQFTSKTDTYFSKMRFPNTIITFGLILHYRYKKTYRDVSKYLKSCGIDVSHVTVHNWARKFSYFINSYTLRPHSDTWYINESITVVNGEKKHLLTIYDSNGNILSTRLSKKKTNKQIEEVIKKAVKLVGFTPKAIMGTQIEPLIARSI